MEGIWLSLPVYDYLGGEEDEEEVVVGWFFDFLRGILIAREGGKEGGEKILSPLLFSSSLLFFRLTNNAISRPELAGWSRYRRS